MMTIDSLDLLFKPRNVAIFEAKKKFSYFIDGFKSQGFNVNNLYLISPSEKELLGLKCYQSFDDLPIDTIDLLILAVGRVKVVQTLKDILNKKKIHFIHIFTAGTGESDEEGLKIENQLKDIVDNNPVRCIGPNCMGLYCPMGHNAYLPIFPKESGNIGLIYHSGDLTTRTIMYGNIRYGLTFSKAVSMGNCISLQVSDFLEYFSRDDETDIICIYFEGFSRNQVQQGRKLYNILKEIQKPVLILRGGKTKRAQTAVLTHTGSLGTDEKFWHAIYNQTPIIEVGSSLDEMIDYLFIFYDFFKKNKNLSLEQQVQFYPKGKNVLVILWSGGLGIIDVDKLTELGLNLPLYEGKTIEKLIEIYPLKIGSLSNPLDLPWISREKGYHDLIKAAITENIDLVIMHTDAMSGRRRDKKRFDIFYDGLKELKAHIESLNKILIMILPEYPLRDRERYYKELIGDGFIVYPDLDRAAKSFLALHEYGKKLKKITFKS